MPREVKPRLSRSAASRPSTTDPVCCNCRAAAPAVATSAIEAEAGGAGAAHPRQQAARRRRQCPPARRRSPGASASGGGSRSLRSRAEVGRHGRGVVPARRQYRRRPTTRRAARGTPRRWRRAIPGLTSTMPHARQRRRGLQTLADPAHAGGRAGEAYRHVGAEPRCQPGQRPGRGASRHSRHSSRSVAAASAEPPPMPGRHRQVLVQHQMRARRHAGLRRQRPRRAQHQIVGFRRQSRGERPVTAATACRRASALSVSPIPANTTRLSSRW